MQDTEPPLTGVAALNMGAEPEKVKFAVTILVLVDAEAEGITMQVVLPGALLVPVQGRYDGKDLGEIKPSTELPGVQATPTVSPKEGGMGNLMDKVETKKGQPANSVLLETREKEELEEIKSSVVKAVVLVAEDIAILSWESNCGGKIAMVGDLQGGDSFARDKHEKGGGVLVAVGVTVAVAVEDSVGLEEEVGVGDTDEVGVKDGVGVEEEVGVGDTDEVGVKDGVGLEEEVRVGDIEGVGVEVGEGVEEIRTGKPLEQLYRSGQVKQYPMA